MVALLVVNAAATWFMTGVIWLVQLVQYPGFALVGDERFAAYHAMHSSRITWVVAPAMLVEIVTSLAIAWRPERDTWLLRVGFACALITWLVTGFQSVPAHARLGLGFDAAAHGRLLLGNWVRTAAWSVHAVTIAAVVLRRLR